MSHIVLRRETIPEGFVERMKQDEVLRQNSFSKIGMECCQSFEKLWWLAGGTFGTSTDPFEWSGPAPEDEIWLAWSDASCSLTDGNLHILKSLMEAQPQITHFYGLCDHESLTGTRAFFMYWDRATEEVKLEFLSYDKWFEVMIDRWG